MEKKTSAIIWNFNIPLSETYKTRKMKEINVETISTEVVQINIYRVLHPKDRGYTLFSST